MISVPGHSGEFGASTGSPPPATYSEIPSPDITATSSSSQTEHGPTTEPPETSRQRRYRTGPYSRTGKFIATFLHGAGPQSIQTIADEFDWRVDFVRLALGDLCREGFVDFAFDEAFIYRATEKWDPDLDEPLKGMAPA